MKRFIISIICILIILIGCKTKEDIQPEGIPEHLYLDTELPIDPDVKIGKLDNGLTIILHIIGSGIQIMKNTTQWQKNGLNLLE